MVLPILSSTPPALVSIKTVVLAVLVTINRIKRTLLIRPLTIIYHPFAVIIHPKKTRTSKSMIHTRLPLSIHLPPFITTDLNITLISTACVTLTIILCIAINVYNSYFPIFYFSQAIYGFILPLRRRNPRHAFYGFTTSYTSSRQARPW